MDTMTGRERREDFRLTFSMPDDVEAVTTLLHEARGVAFALRAAGSPKAAHFYLTIATLADARLRPEKYPSPLDDPVHLIVGGEEPAPGEERSIVLAVLDGLAGADLSPSSETWRRVRAGIRAGDQ